MHGQTVNIDTPMLLHSAMKPLIGLQLATYVDRGILRLRFDVENQDGERVQSGTNQLMVDL